MKKVFIAIALIMIVHSANAQNFSCRGGTRATCLDYGDTVCSTFGKCVDSNSSCFSSFACDYKGFTCKSNLTELATQYDDLRDVALSVQSDCERLQSDYDYLQSDHDDLKDQYEELQEEFKKQNEQFDELKNCLGYASSFDDALYCAIAY